MTSKNAEKDKDEKKKHQSSNCACTSVRQRRVVGVGKGSTDSHLPSRSLDFDLVWWDELRLELAAPLDGAFDALARIFEFPLGRAHVACDGVWPIKPTALPWRIGIIIGEAKRVSILKTTKGNVRFGGTEGGGRVSKMRPTAG
jgi:hypothetical protein